MSKDQYRKAAALLMWGFDWASSPQGDAWWRERYEYLRDMAGISKGDWGWHDFGRLMLAEATGVSTWYIGDPRNKAKGCALIATTVMGFVWSDTPQGGTYWSEVWNILINMADGVSTPKVVDRKRKTKLSKLNPDYVMTKLTVRGYRKLGSGAYSTVFVHDSDPDYVIKVSRQMDDWPEYIRWATENGYAGTIAPKVSALKVYKGEHGQFYVAKVERLASVVAALDYEHPARKTQQAVRNLIDDGMYGKGADEDSLEYAVYEAKRNWYSKRVSPEYVKFAEGLCETFGKHFDLHQYNWMVDANGRLVLTDPLTDQGHTTDLNAVRIKSTAPVFAQAA